MQAEPVAVREGKRGCREKGVQAGLSSWPGCACVWVTPQAALLSCLESPGVPRNYFISESSPNTLVSVWSGARALEQGRGRSLGWGPRF